MKTAVIIPAYNESSRIAAAVQDAAAHADAVIVVSDGSKDHTARNAKAAGAIVLEHLLNRGQGAAIQTGVDFAVHHLDADVIVHFDGDGQMSGSEIKQLIAPLKSGNVDIVLGSRFLGKKPKNMPWTRRMTLIASKWLTRFLSGIAVTDAHCGFRALTADAAKKARFVLDGRAHASEIYDLIHIHGLRHREVPVTISYTEDTLKKGTKFRHGFGVLKDLFKHRFFGSR